MAKARCPTLIDDEPDHDLMLARRAHAEEPLGWENSRKLSGDTADVVAGLKRSEGRDLLIQGSGTLYPAPLAAGLIDRLILMTFSVVLGRGKRIFDGSQAPGALRLVDHFVAKSGVVFTTYEASGAVRTGTFATKPPSDAEVERLEKLKLEETQA